MKIDIKIKDKEIKEMLRKHKEKSQNLKPVMQEISIRMKSETLKRFEEEKDPNGNPWKKLSTNTLANKERLKKLNSNKILNDTGRLKKSIKSDFSGTTSSVYTNLAYATTHQYGANISIRPKKRLNPDNNKKYLKFYTASGWKLAKEVKVKILKRPFIGINDKEFKYLF